MTHNEEDLYFHAMMGRAISAWSMVEHGIAMVLVHCLEPQNTTMIWRGFFAIDNFRTKTRFAEEVFHQSSHAAKHAKQFDALMKMAKNYSTIRNALAHWQVMHYPNAPNGKRRVALVERLSLNDPAHLDSPPPHSLCIRKVALAHDQFNDLWTRFLCLMAEMRGTTSPIAIAHAPPSSLSTMRSLEARMREELGRQPRPSGALPEQEA